MTIRDRRKAATLVPLMRVAGVFGAAGALLFMRVWWPIQAERNLTKLSEVETQISQKKSGLNILNERYASLTSLPVLDQWAKLHGPWTLPSGDNVVALR